VLSRTTLPFPAFRLLPCLVERERNKQLNEEIIWRLRRGDRVVICEIRNDTGAGLGWVVQLLEAGEVPFSKRCPREDDARFAAESFRQDFVRTGFTE
jgi:hypothetical protein